MIPVGSLVALTCFHDLPPSSERKMPPAGPPLVIVHGIRRNCQIPAKSVDGLLGKRTISETPVDGPR